MTDILDFIPYGHTDEPITREALVTLTGLSDRDVRRLINRAKRDGYDIINVGHGYYMPDDPDDPNLKAYILKERHRISEIRKSIRGHERFFKTNKNQETLKL